MTTVTIEYKQVNYSTKNNTITAVEPATIVTFDNGYKISFGGFINELCNENIVPFEEQKKLRGKMSATAAQKFVTKYENAFKQIHTYAA